MKLPELTGMKWNEMNVTECQNDKTSINHFSGEFRCFSKCFQQQKNCRKNLSIYYHLLNLSKWWWWSLSNDWDFRAKKAKKQKKDEKWICSMNFIITQSWEQESLLLLLLWKKLWNRFSLSHSSFYYFFQSIISYHIRSIYPSIYLSTHLSIWPFFLFPSPSKAYSLQILLYIGHQS